MSTGTIDYDRSDDPNPMWKYNKYSTTKYNTTQHDTIQYNATQCNAMQYNTIYTCFSLWLVVLTGS